MITQYDIVIAGAGMVGATLACALADKGLRIALIEPQLQQPCSAQDSYDLRVSAISLASENIFKNLGVWSNIQNMRISPYQEMFVWDALTDAAVHFESTALGKLHLGHIVENRVIQTALLEKLAKCQDVSLHSPAQIKTINENSTKKVIVELDNGDILQAALLVAADGGNSSTREKANIYINEHKYDHHGVVTIVETEHHHGFTAWQRFLPTGPLAFLPLVDGRCSIVWSTQPEHANVLKTISDNEFCQQLAQAFEFKLGNILAVEKRVSFPLQYLHAEHYFSQRVVLIGDAAHVVHPLAGQGVNLGLLDAAQLAEQIIIAHQQQRDLGSQLLLKRYERYRKPDNQLMLSALDSMKKLFGYSSMGSQIIRSTGFKMVNNYAPIKNIFMQHAAGVNVKLPMLARSI